MDLWILIIVGAIVAAIVLSRQEPRASRARRAEAHLDNEWRRIVNEQYGGDEARATREIAAWRARGGVFAPEIDHNE